MLTGGLKKQSALALLGHPPNVIVDSLFLSRNYLQPSSAAFSSFLFRFRAAKVLPFLDNCHLPVLCELIATENAVRWSDVCCGRATRESPAPHLPIAAAADAIESAICRLSNESLESELSQKFMRQGATREQERERAEARTHR